MSADNCPGPTHYEGCACHEQAWKNKWQCAVEMAAQAKADRDELLEALKEVYQFDGQLTTHQWAEMKRLIAKFSGKGSA